MTYTFDQTLLTNIQILTTLFVAVLFIQSGFDKVFDFKGNQGYINSVFEKTFLRSVSSFLFIVIVVLEVVASVLCFGGAFVHLFVGMKDISIIGLQLAAFSIFCLFVGQRIAKDYAGAASLVSYFLVCIFGIFLFALKG
jgi:putative oxidoreductase